MSLKTGIPPHFLTRSGTAVAAPTVPWSISDTSVDRHAERTAVLDRRAEQSAAADAECTTCDLACRALNVIVAVVGVILTAPVMLLIVIAIRLSSPGPAIYTQPRIGLDRRGSSSAEGRRGRDRRSVEPDPLSGRRHHDRRTTERSEGRRGRDQGGRVFTIYKFRTMRPEDPNANQVWALADDPRVTAIGKLLRATRLDELPQLFNVIKGDMNVVGPRPEQPRIFAELSAELSNYRDRQKVLPGITGLAQVRLGYDQTIDDVKRKVELDLEYIRRRSASEDLLIMARTMPVMVSQKVWM